MSRRELLWVGFSFGTLFGLVLGMAAMFELLTSLGL